MTKIFFFLKNLKIFVIHIYVFLQLWFCPKHNPHFHRFLFNFEQILWEVSRSDWCPAETFFGIFANLLGLLTPPPPLLNFSFFLNFPFARTNNRCPPRAWPCWPRRTWCWPRRASTVWRTGSCARWARSMCTKLRNCTLLPNFTLGN